MNLAPANDATLPISAMPLGLHAAVPESVYHRRERGVASKHALDELERAPAMLLQWLEAVDEREDPKPFRLGRAAHMAILEPQRFRSSYVIEPDFGPQRKTDTCSSEQAKENKLRRQAWRAEHASCTVLESAEARTTFGMVKALAAHPRAAALIEGGEPELTAIWLDPATGLRCKGRLDLYRRDLATVVDIKTAEDAREEAFRRVAERCTYHRQGGMYRDGLVALEAPVEAFALIVVEKSPPHLIRVWELDPSDLARGSEEIRDLLQQYAWCLHSGEWPGYPANIERLRLRPWRKGDYE